MASSYGAAVYTDTMVSGLAEFSREHAARCCACDECGGVYPCRSVPRTGNQPFRTCGECWTDEREVEWSSQLKKVEEEHARLARREADSIGAALDREAALALRSLMSELSERCWCARWMEGTENFLWEAASGVRCGEHPSPVEWGWGSVGGPDIARLHALHVASGGWWHFDDSGAKLFVVIADWERMCACGSGA